MFWYSLFNANLIKLAALPQSSERKKLQKAIVSKVKRLGGPCTDQLDHVLQSLHIARQAYRSGSFVGNHVHKMLKVSPLRRLLSGMKYCVTVLGWPHVLC